MTRRAAFQPDLLIMIFTADDIIVDEAPPIIWSPLIASTPHCLLSLKRGAMLRTLSPLYAAEDGPFRRTHIDITSPYHDSAYFTGCSRRGADYILITFATIRRSLMPDTRAGRRAASAISG